MVYTNALGSVYVNKLTFWIQFHQTEQNQQRIFSILTSLKVEFTKVNIIFHSLFCLTFWILLTNRLSPILNPAHPAGGPDCPWPGGTQGLHEEQGKGEDSSSSKPKPGEHSGIHVQARCGQRVALPPQIFNCAKYCGVGRLTHKLSLIICKGLWWFWRGQWRRCLGCVSGSCAPRCADTGRLFS